MAGRPKSINHTKVFDVAKPGRSKPQESSRPVIINHSAAVKDGSMLTDTMTEEQKNEDYTAPSATRRVIKPVTLTVKDGSSDAADSTDTKPSITILNEPKKAAPKSITIIDNTDSANTDSPTAPTVEEPTLLAETTDKPQDELEENAEDKSNAVVTAKPLTKKKVVVKAAKIKSAELTTEQEVDEAALDTEGADVDANETDPDGAMKLSPEDFGEEPAEEEAEATEPDAEDETSTDASPASSDSASVDALAEASKKPKEDEKAAELQTKRDAALQELIDSKKYYVPLAHDSTKKAGHAGAWVALLIIILLAVGAYAAVDAKLIEAPIDLPHHFFKQ